MFWLTIFLFAAFVFILSFSSIRLFRQKDSVRAKAVAVTGGFYAVLFLCCQVFRLRVPSWVLLLAMLAAFISAYLGQYLQMYYRSKVFDRYVHMYGSFSFSLLFYYFLGHFLSMGSSALFLAVFTFCLGNTLGVIFELLEFYLDEKPNPVIKSQHGLKDTDMDMLFNLFGSAAAAALVFVL